MKQLGRNESSQLAVFIKSVTKGRRGSWLSVGLGSYFGESRQVRSSNVLAAAAEALLREEPLSELLVFPEPDVEASNIAAEASKIVAAELVGYCERSQVGCINYYILPARLPPAWCMVMCHENDVHLLGAAAKWKMKRT